MDGVAYNCDNYYDASFSLFSENAHVNYESENIQK